MIFTDSKGYICNVSMGLISVLGLHSKFFKYSNDSFMSMIRLDQIAPLALDPQVADALESDGMVVTFDTTDILGKVEAETLSHEDLELIRPHLKKQDIFLRISKVPLGEN